MPLSSPGAMEIRQGQFGGGCIDGLCAVPRGKRKPQGSGCGPEGCQREDPEGCWPDTIGCPFAESVWSKLG